MHISYWFDIINFGLAILIWLVQLIIYPSLAYVNKDEFINWHSRYVRAISIIVSPLMLAQMILAVALLVFQPNSATIFIFFCIIIIWIASFSLSVPCHTKLSRNGKDHAVIDRLVGTNWIRTILWTAVFLIGILT